MFPLSTEGVAAFESLKKSMERSVVAAIDEVMPFEVENDASEVVISCDLKQQDILLLSSQGHYKDPKSDILLSRKSLRPS